MRSQQAKANFWPKKTRGIRANRFERVGVGRTYDPPAFSLAQTGRARPTSHGPAGVGREKREPSMIRVVAVINAKPGRRDEILAAFRANVPSVRAEQGCIEYAAHADAAGIGPFQAKFGPDVFVVLETWASAETLAAHVAAPHMAA
jgi:quinol monooxygenase YgiN